MPLCREAVFGPAFTPGSGSGHPSPFRSALHLAARGGEMKGGSEGKDRAAQWTRPKGRAEYRFALSPIAFVFQPRPRRRFVGPAYTNPIASETGDCGAATRLPC